MRFDKSCSKWHLSSIYRLNSVIYFNFYKNHKLSFPYPGMSLPRKWGAISAMISEYLMVTGRFCRRIDFQYMRLNWLSWWVFWKWDFALSWCFEIYILMVLNILRFADLIDKMNKLPIITDQNDRFLLSKVTIKTSYQKIQFHYFTRGTLFGKICLCPDLQVGFHQFQSRQKYHFHSGRWR